METLPSPNKASMHPRAVLEKDRKIEVGFYRKITHDQTKYIFTVRLNGDPKGYRVEKTYLQF